MYVNIGGDLSVRDQSIVGIFDLDKAKQSKRSRKFLSRAQEDGSVLEVGDEPKAFVLTQEYGLERVYLTQLGSAALERRVKSGIHNQSPNHA